MTTYLSSRLAGPANAASGTSTAFTGTTAHTYVIRSIFFANNTSGPITIKIGIGGVADSNLILAETVVQSKDTFVMTPDMLVLSGTETLQINASASGGTITVNGVDAS